jgi:plastocyanin
MTVSPGARRQRRRLGLLLAGATSAAALVPGGRAVGSLAGSPAADTVITIRAQSSTLEYVPPHVSARTGTRVQIRFVNEGTLPHNIVLPRSEDDIDALALAAYEAAETGYVPLAQKERMLAWSTLASPGQTVEVTFTVPAPGEYRYVCLFPGHANSMLGTLRALR